MNPLAALRRLFTPSRPPVTTHSVPCASCRGLRSYESLAGDTRSCAACRGPAGEPTGVEFYEFCRPGVLLGTLRPRRHDAEEVAEIAARLSRLSDGAARDAIDRERRLAGRP